ncbi:MAG: alanine racemase [Deltaproteobacteria bacterium]|nr:alanine racemase [Deltaproteobacteria bacterium]
MDIAPRAVATIDLDRLARNLARIRARVGPEVRVLGVVKADAYGHGMEPVARRLVAEGVWGLGVSSPSEGLFLRSRGIDAPILVLAGARPDEARAVVRHHLTAMVDNADEAKALSDAARAQDRTARIHVKIDTGMGRLGLLPDELVPFLRFVRQLGGLEVEGLMSHLSVSEDESPAGRDFTARQLALFDAKLDEARAAGFASPITHVANSGGALYHPIGRHNLVRPGLALYGVHPGRPEASGLDLEPVMEVRATVLRVRELPAGASVSYRRLFVTERATRLAVLAIGYADGVPVLLSNRGELTVGGARRPIRGAVTMDMTLVDVTDAPHVVPGDEAILFGHTPGVPSVAEVAALASTIPYEMLCSIGPRVKRIHAQHPSVDARSDHE